MAIKDTLSRMLAERNMKASELSRLSGVTEASISEYLNGKKEPMGKQGIAMAKALNVSLDDLYESEWAGKVPPSIPTLTPAAHRIGRLYDKADERARDIVEVTLKPFDDGKVIMLPKEEYATESTPALIELRLYTQRAAAGLGNYLDDNDYETVCFTNVPKRTNIAVKVSGDSMEPEYNDGDIVFVETESVLRNGEIGIFNYDGQGFIKKIKTNPARLVSLNKKYEDILLREEMSFYTIGRVLGVARESKG